MTKTIALEVAGFQAFAVVEEVNKRIKVSLYDLDSEIVFFTSPQLEYLALNEFGVDEHESVIALEQANVATLTKKRVYLNDQSYYVMQVLNHE